MRMAISPRLAISSLWKDIATPVKLGHGLFGKPVSTFPGHALSVFHGWIEHDAQGFAKRIECQGHNQNGKPRRVHLLRRDLHILVGPGQHGAPARVGWLDTEPEEAEAGFR